MCSWALECFTVFLVSLQTLLFCLISLLYAWLYQLQVYHSVSKVFKTIGAPFCHLLLLSPLLCLIPINPAVTTSVPCLCHLFSSQVPHKSELPLKHFPSYSEEIFGHSPITQVSSVHPSFRMESFLLHSLHPRNRKCGLTIGFFPDLCLKLLLGKLSQSSDLTKADLYPRLCFQKCSPEVSNNHLL